jgi:hypothetical protein
MSACDVVDDTNTTDDDSGTSGAGVHSGWRIPHDETLPQL